MLGAELDVRRPASRTQPRTLSRNVSRMQPSLPGSTSQRAFTFELATARLHAGQGGSP